MADAITAASVFQAREDRSAEANLPEEKRKAAQEEEERGMRHSSTWHKSLFRPDRCGR